MKVFLLIYSVGCSTGYKELIGIYNTIEKAKEAKKNDMRVFTYHPREDQEYLIEEIEVDEALNYVFVEW